MDNQEARITITEADALLEWVGCYDDLSQKGECMSMY